MFGQFIMPAANIQVALSDATGWLLKLSSVLEDVSRAAAQTDTSPTVAERTAGNYRKGKTKLHGMTISIENPKGSYREGVDKQGKKWRTEMAAHYGYILGTVGADKDHVDCFIGEQPNSELVFVIDQIDPGTKKFDEHKIVFGVANEDAARKLYLDSYAKGWKGLDSIEGMTIAQFKNRFLDRKKAAAIEGEVQSTETKQEQEEGWSLLDGLSDEGQEIGLPLTGA